MRRRIVAPASRFLLAVLTLTLTSNVPARAQQESSLPTASKRQNAKYVGLTKCAACHFEKYKDWKLSEHAKAFDILPKKYRNDATCLKCHVTTPVTAERLAARNVASYEQGVSCESCHGPGSDHADYALRFVNEPITEDSLRQLREKIQRIDMLQCINCHISKAHKKHPPFDRDGSARRISQKKRSAGFFHMVHGGQGRNTEIGAIDRPEDLPDY